MSRTDFLDETLREIERAGRLRTLRAVEPLGGMRVRVAGREAVNFCSNDYLGLSRDARVCEAAARAARDLGAGAGAARLITGTREIHLELERSLAGFFGAPAALLFGAGYLAALGTIPALVGRGDAVFSDARNHASLIDGCRLSGAQVVVYPHADADALADQMKAREGRRCLVVTESVFSMDGDLAPLTRIADLCDREGALLLVDEAHAIGVVGGRGEGMVPALGLAERVDVRIGTLGKALGSFGAFVLGSRVLVDSLVNRARTFLFHTALPPAAVGAALSSLRILAASPELSARLRANARAMRERLGDAAPAGSSDSAILPIILGTEEAALRASSELLERGILVQAIRPPTVPPGTSRLRVTVSAAHTDEEIDLAARAIREVVRRKP